MENYKPNSNLSKMDKKERAEKKVDKVVTGKTRSRKKSGISRLTNALFNKDIDGVKNYILVDILLPAAKRALDDAFTYAKDMYLYGESRGSRSRGGVPASKVSYRSYYDSRREDRRERRDSGYNRARVAYDCDDILYDNRGDAEAVLDRMIEIIEDNGFVSVATLRDMSGVPIDNYVDNKYGWSDLSTASPMRTKEGYVLKLPRAMPIDD